jgi:hypothetical protein
MAALPKRRRGPEAPVSVEQSMVSVAAVETTALIEFSRGFSYQLSEAKMLASTI